MWGQRLQPSTAGLVERATDAVTRRARVAVTGLRVQVGELEQALTNAEHAALLAPRGLSAARREEIRKELASEAG